MKNTSGNYLVDLYESFLNECDLYEKKLECGCLIYCKCDKDWDDRD